ncbi:hypothetical protein [Rubrivirga sp.]|uniref:hypothetical protein n=1 Tax=Rubrivirga sp. TaxID=1885344 RepID=UPI003B51896C
MKRSDGLLIALNAALLLFSLLGFASAEEEVLIVGAMLAMVTATINGVVLHRRRDREPSKKRARPVDELDARTILDLDARLEALEQAQADAADAARWRALVESGQVTGPAADATGTTTGGPGAALRNGR